AQNDKAPPEVTPPEGRFLNGPVVRFFIMLWVLGITAFYRGAFWRFLFTVLWRFPHRFLQAMDKAAVGHHFLLYTRDVLRGNRAVTTTSMATAASPPPSDTLAAPPGKAQRPAALLRSAG